MTQHAKWKTVRSVDEITTDLKIELADAAAHIQALEEENKVQARASSLSAQDLARVHIRNEARLAARIKQLEEALRGLAEEVHYAVDMQDDYVMTAAGKASLAVADNILNAALSPAPATKGQP